MTHTLISALFLLLVAQDAPPQPTFRTGVNLIEVDVVVSDRAGRPVRGLRQEDFEIFEDGKPVEVATFVAVDLPAATAGAGIPAADRSGTSVASNDQPDDGRVMLIVLDDYHVSFDGRRMVASKAVARRLVERLGPSDQAAVIVSSGRSGAQTEFTADKARLVEAIDKFFPQSEHGAPGIAGRSSALGRADAPFGFVGEIKARWAMDALSNAARTLAMLPHRRKAVLLVSQGLPVTLEAVISNPSAGSASQALRDFILTAQRSNIAVYPIDPCGLDLDDGCSAASRDNLRSIADGTGGFAVTNTNAPETGVDRMVEENGTYYLIGYYSPAPANDGRRHRIRVRTRVPGVEVRAREGYVSPRKGSKPAVPAEPLPALIGSPIQTRGLTLRVVAIPIPVSSDPASAVVVGIELPAALAVGAGRVDFSVVAVDDNGRTRARVGFTSTFAATAELGSRWTRTATRLDVPPGRYQIRVAAVAADGERGSVFTEITVPKFDGDLSPGGLSLGLATPLGTAGADRLDGVLPLLPVAARDLPPHTPVAAQLPIRISTKAASNPLAIVSRLVYPDGTAVQLDSATLPAREYSGRAGKVYHVSLPPLEVSGAYRLVVEAVLDRARATREIEFRVASQPR